jgi:hypothetical protein
MSRHTPKEREITLTRLERRTLPAPDTGFYIAKDTQGLASPGLCRCHRSGLENQKGTITPRSKTSHRCRILPNQSKTKGPSRKTPGPYHQLLNLRKVKLLLHRNPGLHTRQPIHLIRQGVPPQRRQRVPKQWKQINRNLIPRKLIERLKAAIHRVLRQRAIRLSLTALCFAPCTNLTATRRRQCRGAFPNQMGSSRFSPLLLLLQALEQ